MSLSFPVSLAYFFSKVGIVDMTFELTENVTVGRTAGGNLIVTEYGTRRWRGDVQLRTLPRAAQEEVISLIRSLQNARATFLVTPRQHVQAFTSGSMSAVANPNVVTLTGLPPSINIKAGLYFSFSYGGRRALHQTTETLPTNSSGVLSNVEITPPLRSGYGTPQSVEYGSPACLARMVPGSFVPPRHASVITPGPRFQWEQVI